MRSAHGVGKYCFGDRCMACSNGALLSQWAEAHPVDLPDFWEASHYL